MPAAPSRSAPDPASHNFSMYARRESASRSWLQSGCFRSVCAGGADVLRNGDAHEMHDEQESVDDAEEFERDPVKVHENDRQTQSEQETGDQCHERQSPAELIGCLLSN